jgi:hypothetical protein
MKDARFPATGPDSAAKLFPRREKARRIASSGASHDRALLGLSGAVPTEFGLGIPRDGAAHRARLDWREGDERDGDVKAEAPPLPIMALRRSSPSRTVDEK